MLDATPLIFPQLGPVYQALFPWAETLARRGGVYAGPPWAAQHVGDVSIDWCTVAQQIDSQMSSIAAAVALEDFGACHRADAAVAGPMLALDYSLVSLPAR